MRVWTRLKSNWLFLLLSFIGIGFLPFGAFYKSPYGVMAVFAAAALAAALCLPHLLSYRGIPSGRFWKRTLLAAGFSFLFGQNISFTLAYVPAYVRWTFACPSIDALLAWLLPVLGGLCVFFPVQALLLHLPNCLSCAPQRIGRNSAQRRDTVLLLAYSALVAFVILLVCTKSSPLYPINDWVDANCFLTVGRAMANGKVLYRDIYEQKGPWLYFLHALCYQISKHSFFGVFLLEWTAAAAFLFFSGRLIRLFGGRGEALLLPLLGAAVYTAKAFCHGDSAEELALPLLLAVLYLSERAFAEERILSVHAWIAVGVCAGLVFWMKYNIAVFFVGWAVVPLWQTVRKAGLRGILKSVGALLGGLLLASLPVAVYCAVTDSFSALWQAYFYNNLFLYAADAEEQLSALSVLMRLLQRWGSGIALNPWFGLSGLLAVLWCAATAKKGVRLHLSLSLAAMLAALLSGRVAYFYYYLPLAVFAPYAAVFLSVLLARILPVCRRTAVRCGSAALSVAVACALCFSYSQNVPLMQQKKEDLAQYRFAEIINSIDEPTLLNYGFLDGGFYFAADLVPESRYFCTLNIQLPDMFAKQWTEVYTGKPDFVVTRNLRLKSAPYICVATQKQQFEGVTFTYSLYAAERLLPALAESGVLSAPETE